MEIIAKTSNKNINNKVKIGESRYGTELYTTRNGYQWTSFQVDIDMLKLIRDSINEYLAIKGE